MTAHDEEAAEERASRGGASDFLRKPLDAWVLLEQVRRALRQPPAA